jgi:hypothetical protein
LSIDRGSGTGAKTAPPLGTSQGHRLDGQPIAKPGSIVRPASMAASALGGVTGNPRTSQRRVGVVGSWERFH